MLRTSSHCQRAFFRGLCCSCRTRSRRRMSEGIRRRLHHARVDSATGGRSRAAHQRVVERETIQLLVQILELLPCLRQLRQQLFSALLSCRCARPSSLRVLH